MKVYLDMQIKIGKIKTLLRDVGASTEQLSAQIPYQTRNIMRVLKNRSSQVLRPMVTTLELVFMLEFHRTKTLDRSIGSYAKKMNLSRETVRKYASSLVAKGMMNCYSAGRRRIFLISALGIETIRDYLDSTKPSPVKPFKRKSKKAKRQIKKAQ